MTNMPTPHPFFVSRAIANIEHMAPSWFALVMGWCGLSQAWLRGAELLGEHAHTLGMASGAFSALLFGLLCLASIIRLSAHPRAVEADLQHPVRHAFMATLPISILLLASLGIAFSTDSSHRVVDLRWFCCGAWAIQPDFVQPAVRQSAQHGRTAPRVPGRA